MRKLTAIHVSNTGTSSNVLPRNKVYHETGQIYPNSAQPLHVGCSYEQRVVNNKCTCDNDRYSNSSPTQSLHSEDIVQFPYLVRDRLIFIFKGLANGQGLEAHISEIKYWNTVKNGPKGINP